jgi:hypothetical protein
LLSSFVGSGASVWSLLAAPVVSGNSASVPTGAEGVSVIGKIPLLILLGRTLLVLLWLYLVLIHSLRVGYYVGYSEVITAVGNLEGVEEEDTTVLVEQIELN